MFCKADAKNNQNCKVEKSKNQVNALIKCKKKKIIIVIIIKLYKMATIYNFRNNFTIITISTFATIK